MNLTTDIIVAIIFYMGYALPTKVPNYETDDYLTDTCTGFVADMNQLDSEFLLMHWVMNQKCQNCYTAIALIEIIYERKHMRRELFLELSHLAGKSCFEDW